MRNKNTHFLLHQYLYEIQNNKTSSMQLLLVSSIYMPQLVKALRYNPEGRGFDSRCCQWNFSLT
jgi:hypothetical protein